MGPLFCVTIYCIDAKQIVKDKSNGYSVTIKVKKHEMDLTFGLDAFTVDPVRDFLAATAALSSMILNFSTLPAVFETGIQLSFLLSLFYFMPSFCRFFRTIRPFTVYCIYSVYFLSILFSVNNGATKPGESCFPNIVCAFNSLLAFYYGKLMLDWTLLTSGLIGSICYSSYIFIFIQYCPRESISTTQTMLLSLWFILIRNILKNELKILANATCHMFQAENIDRTIIKKYKFKLCVLFMR